MDVLEDFYDLDSSHDKKDTDDTPSAKRGLRRKVRSLVEFSIVIGRLKKGLSERHLANFVWYSSVHNKYNVCTMDKLHKFKIWPRSVVQSSKGKFGSELSLRLPTFVFL